MKSEQNTKSEQQPKEIKVELSIEVKDKPLPPKLARRKKRAHVVGTIFSIVFVVLLFVCPYILVTCAGDWSDEQVIEFMILCAVCILSSFIERVCSYIERNPSMRKRDEGDSFTPYDY